MKLRGKCAWSVVSPQQRYSTYRAKFLLSLHNHAESLLLIIPLKVLFLVINIRFWHSDAEGLYLIAMYEITFMLQSFVRGL